ncbi:unnamed protein product [Coccothraustes coccothraustes]
MPSSSATEPALSSVANLQTCGIHTQHHCQASERIRQPHTLRDPGATKPAPNPQQCPMQTRDSADAAVTVAVVCAGAMEKEVEDGWGCDVGWNKHQPGGTDNGRGRYSCAGSVADNKGADGVTTVVMTTADHGDGSTLTHNVGGNLSREQQLLLAMKKLVSDLQ